MEHSKAQSLIGVFLRWYIFFYLHQAIQICDDAKLATGRNPVVVYPKLDLLKAPFQVGDHFDHIDAPMDIKVLKKNKDESFLIEVKVD